MKNFLFVLVFVVLACAVVLAGPLGVGATVGSPVSWGFGGTWDDTLDLLDDGSNDPGLGISLGGFGFYDITPSITIQAEALVALYVWGMEGKFGGDDTTVSSQLFLAEFPIIGKYKLPLGPGAITIFVGPDLFYGIGVIDTRTEQGSNDPVDSGGELGTRLVFGATGGIGYDLPLGPGFVSLDMRYTRLLTPFEGEIDDTKVEFENSIHAVSLYLSYSYRFGGRRGH